MAKTLDFDQQISTYKLSAAVLEMVTQTSNLEFKSFNMYILIIRAGNCEK